MSTYLGWVVAAFLAGLLIAGWREHHRPSLQHRVFQIGVFAGRSYAEILKAMNAPQTETRQPDGRTLRTWRSGDYSISLAFDAQNVCLGVEEEGT